MNGWVHSSAERRSLLAILLLLALLMRALIPAGFMPAATSTGIVIQLCSDSIGKTVLIDLKAAGAPKKPLPDEQRKAGDSPCVFAASAGHLLLPTVNAAALALPFYRATALGIVTPRLHWLPLLAAPPPPVRGPPLPA